MAMHISFYQEEGQGVVATSACALGAHQAATLVVEVMAAGSYLEEDALVMEVALMWRVLQKAHYFLARNEEPRCW
jgi:hypothetical protein